MKVALCISGETRNYNHPLVSDHFYKNLFDIYQPDVFLSVWDHKGMSQYPPKPRDESYFNCKINELELLNFYKNAKDIKIENQDRWLHSQSESIISLWNNYKVNGKLFPTSIPQLYKIWHANEMKKKFEKDHNFKYDVVIRFRPDLIMLDPLCINFENCDSIIHMNTPRFFFPNRIYDLFFFSKSENMNKICKAWVNFNEIINTHIESTLPAIDPCRILYIQCLRENLSIKSLDKNICDVYRNEKLEEIRKFLLD